MPNSLAYIALVLWPVVVVVLFHRLPKERALVWSILGGYLLLPPVANIDLPAIPPMDKLSIPAISAYLVARFMKGYDVPLLPRSRLAQLLMLVFVLGPFGTIMVNPEAIPVAARAALPGLSPYDAISIIAGQVFAIMTFAMARSMLATATALREILLALVIGGLVYSVPMLIEIRLSPQMNVWIYGFFQHSFEQMMRQGGFRPIVFLQHGLWVAFFAMTTAIAAVSLARSAAGPERQRMLLAAGYLMLVLLLCKSIGSLAYGVALAPLVWLLPQRWLIRIAVACTLLTLGYPLLRAFDYFPADQLVEFATRYSAERAQSLAYRFDNEALLLEHAFRKPWFGWGGYERNLLHDPFDGKAITVSDGRWIVVIGQLGWMGLIGEFGLIALPILLIWREAAARRGTDLAAPVGATMVILGINMVDMLPNATLTPLSWLFAGALLGHAELLADQRRRQARTRAQDAPIRTLI